jgi:uncharacterized surface protein with fasciclin (FAS1) repeats
MYKFQKNLFCLLLILLTFAGCRKKAYDDYYGRPASLAPSIYQTLQSKGNFTSLLACIDKAGYTSTLSTAGYWTMFAPNDDAFKKYFVSVGITDVSQINAATATKIVTYALVYNAFQTDHLSDLQSTTGWVPNQAFRRRTVYHDNIDTLTIRTANYLQPTMQGQKINFVSENRNGGGFVYGDFNNKYIPYFTAQNFANYLLTAADYNYFFPTTTYTGFNVVGGSVVNKDIVCENGVMHEVNSVTLPLSSLDVYLASNPNYSSFKKLLDKYMVTYNQDVNTTHLNQVLTGSTAPVYVKTYSSLLAFAPNNENYLKLFDNDGQASGYTLFVPTNDKVDAYVNSVLLEHYPSVDKLPIQVIADFLNAHFFAGTVWPSKFATNNNSLGEPARFDPANDIIDKKVCSNGFFYGTNKVEQPNAFSTVYGRVYLDTAYSFMKTSLDASGIKLNLTNLFFKYTLLMVSNTQFRNAGYNFNTTTNQFTYQPVGGTLVTGAVPSDQIKRIINLGIYRTENNELANLPSSGGGVYEAGGLGGFAAEYVKYTPSKTIVAAGNVESNTALTVTTPATQTSNGIVYYTTGLPLQYSTNIVNAISFNISKYGTLATDPYYMFWQYLKVATIYNATTGAIQGVDAGGIYTVFVPTNAAIQDAVNNGWLPGTGTGAVKVANYASTAVVDQALVNNFIKYHIIKGFSVVPDGKKSNTAYPTLLANSNGDITTLSVVNAVNNMQIFDGQILTGNVKRFAVANSQNNVVLGNYVVINPINTYLQYIDPYNQSKY